VGSGEQEPVALGSARDKAAELHGEMAALEKDSGLTDDAGELLTLEAFEALYAEKTKDLLQNNHSKT
jgi:hypothetical protein